ncbi:bifunctional UDP-N-acetylglucosamine diphosphorylase/glucosamine-1-phosphate N-acetyltransferase GlmU [Mesoaciditoga lauensis]|uniref:bifunctional UDP-N-acetylglucosamine diphosphorylase/glucosamine-1-phosphate N-acetyltransferase GlmU n=1 Tax=Mesoaciditoga lauensis TaxID=1495039 RepID=UPI00055A955F|nr:bifunctional UDP-N-acetylglucosamine diphosphorylase/glucosamine-1-phosphate N-acetyltransferase GlmU [Mesoaciditoga lauensis]
MKRVLILAGGLGKRMRSPKPKVLHEILEKPLISWVIDAASAAGITKIGVVLGHNSEEVQNVLPTGVEVYIQSKQLGTADAVKCARNFLDGKVVVLYGDAPLIKPETIKRLASSEADMSILTAKVSDPTGYGRIVRENGRISKIVEQADANEETLKINEINSGMYAFKSEALKFALDKIKSSNKKGEYYLTDAVEILLNNDYKVDTIEVEDSQEILGANTQRELANLAKIARERILDDLMEKGVTIEDPTSTFIGPDVNVEAGVIVKPFTFIYGKTTIESESVIGPQTTLRDTFVGRNSYVVRSECEGADISNGCGVGPFSRLRPGTRLEKNVKIGNFVEVKNSHIFEGVKAQHLTYLGDATVEENTNIGAGTITCNYDGIRKNKTFIGKNAFIGSNTALVAPVEIGEGALIGAGSVITENVPSFALALGRARQVNKEKWVLKKMEENHEK